ncbi:MAG: ABC transporter ATP-binding protein, partial [candidate division Zixibacteria bacterium]|nr:ABC transporter ATP-binding protein [candidate division Zixibacteria bacterium]
MADLILKNLCKAFGDLSVVNDISLELTGGELMVLLGPSGCGKTTLLRLIAGLESTDSGEIFIAGRRVDQLRPKDRNIAMVFQNYSLYPHMTVEKNLAFPLKIASVGKNERQQRVEAVAEMLSLSEKLKARPAQLSGGQRQRVALGRAIIRQPDLFLLDEPLSNLDADLRTRMRHEIVALQKKLGITTVHVTHDQAEALTMADRIAVINNGRIEQVGTPEALYKNPANLFVAQFIGQPKINLIDARIERHLLIPFGLSMLNLNIDRDNSRLLVGLRPEAITICSDGEFVADVVGNEYLGSEHVVTLDFQGASIVASGASKQYAVGQSINFSIDS